MTQACPPESAVPPEMLVEARWVIWRYEIRNGKETKVPYRADGRGRASSTDAQTWGTFADASVTASVGDYSGVGFVLGDGFAGVDLDDCLSDAGTFTWGSDIVGEFNTYGEVSPSGTGVKLFMLGRKPVGFDKCKQVGVGPDGEGDIEVYDGGRFFAFTGEQLSNTPPVLSDCTGPLSAVCRRYLSGGTSGNQKLNGHPHKVNGHTHGNTVGQSDPVPPNGESPASLRLAIAAMLTATANVTDGGDGSRRLFTVACRAVELDLTDDVAVQAINLYAKLQPFPSAWPDAEIIKRLRSAESRPDVTRGSAKVDAGPAPIVVRPAHELIEAYPEQRPAVIGGLIRVGETMNLVSGPKTFKSHTVASLFVAAATGGRWLDTYDVRPGRVLMIDNELYPDTFAHRLRTVCGGMGVKWTDLADRFDVVSLRGNLQSLFELESFFRSIEPGKYTLVALDAIYRMLPDDEGAENSNSVWANIYNVLDRHAMRLSCAFVVVHHTSKGVQGGKAVTDVGAGAGAQSRAADAHVVIRPHEEDGCVVIEGEVRTFAKPEPLCCRWSYPLWHPDPALDPNMLLRERGRGGRPRKEEQTKAERPEPVVWTPETFVTAFVRGEPDAQRLILAKAESMGVRTNQAEKLLLLAEDQKLVFRHKKPGDNKAHFATREPNLMDMASTGVCVSPAPPIPPTVTRPRKGRKPGN